MSVDLLKAAYLTRLAKLPHGENALNYTQEDKKKKKVYMVPYSIFPLYCQFPIIPKLSSLIASTVF